MADHHQDMRDRDTEITLERMKAVEAEHMEHTLGSGLLRAIASGETGADYSTCRSMAESLIETRANLNELLEAAVLGLAMLGIEARSWREHDEPEKAKPIEGAMDVIRAAIENAKGA